MPSIVASCFVSGFRLMFCGGELAQMPLNGHLLKTPLLIFTERFH